MAVRVKGRQTWKPNLFIDASGSVLGRIASHAAKQALLGKTVAVLNCEKVIVSGNRKTTINEFKIMRFRGGHSLNGPFYPKHPARIVKRTIRGMLRYTTGRGESAFNRVRCFEGIPAEYKDEKKVSIVKHLNAQTINLTDLGRQL
jgi:large subunit ribosomal protein L13